MKNIGKYNGIPCYECTDVEWKERYDRGQDNGKQIFIIDGVMVKNNKIVGHYNGSFVTDRYDEQPYFIEMRKVDNGDVMAFNKQKKATATADNSKWDKKFAEEVGTKAETATAVSYEELVKQDINFGNYSTVVDQFFALLEV